MRVRLLLVDEEAHFLRALARRLEASGFPVHTAAGPEEALEFAAEHDVDVVILGVSIEANDSLTTLRQIKRVRPRAEIIVLTDQSSVELSMQAMKLGAYDCLQKPTNIAELVEKIIEAKKRKGSRRR
jgi:DNA-binding NtrC family response regulator